jgi:hypothetical protein
MEFSLIEVLVIVIVSYFVIVRVVQEHIDTQNIISSSFVRKVMMGARILLFLLHQQIVELKLFHSFIKIIYT